MDCLGKCLLSIATALAIPLCSSAANPAKILNINSTMELGLPGDGVPGYTYRVAAIKGEQAFDNSKKLYLPITADNGKSGKCLLLPGREGIINQQLFIEPFYINENTDIELSFDAKIGPDVNGVLHPVGDYNIHFRCYGDEAVSNSKPYPVMYGFGFKPDQQWKTFKFKAKAIAWHNSYYLALLCTSPETEKAPNALYLDNFRITAGSSTPILENEIAAFVDNPFGLYRKDETVEVKVRALLLKDSEKAEVAVVSSSDHDGKQAWSRIVKLERTGVLEEAEGTRGIYEGYFEFPAESFGAFSMAFSMEGKTVKSVGGDYSAIHKPILHERLSPGWGIGVNFDGFQSLRCSSKGYDYVGIEYGCLDNYCKLFRQGGLNLVRYWSKWKVVEPKKDEFTTQYFQPDVDLLKKYDLAIMLCLGEWKINGPKPDASRLEVPEYLFEQHSRKRLKVNGSRWIWPSLDIYKRYLDFLLANWGKDIDVWEFLNEPGMGNKDAENWTAKDYLEYLKFTYNEVKASNKNAIVLGNGVTTDFGAKAENWCSDLNEADPDYETYLDGIAFHPYAAALDYQEGSYGKYTNLIEKIRGLLKHQKPLWNTECFYLPDHKGAQIHFYKNLGRYGASEIQRHILEGLQNGVVATNTIDQSSLFKFKMTASSIPVTGEVFAGTNALSFLFKDMVKIENLKFNKFIKAGLFTDAKNRKALGFVYDLRPSGCTWKLPEDLEGVEIVDLFGNPVKERTIAIGYHPYYLLGKPEAVKALLTSDSFRVKDALQINARIFRDRIYFDGKSDVGGIWTADVAFVPCKWLKTPETVQFAFTDGIDNCAAPFRKAVVAEVGEPLKWKATNKGEYAGEGFVKIIPSYGNYEIPFGDSAPLALSLNKGDKAWVWADNAALHVKVEVKDSELIPARDGKSLWTGDALEVFLDPNPFSRLERKETQGLNILQYLFAAVPAKDGKEAAVIRIEKEEGVSFDTAATRTVERNGNGYVLTASIPWNEIKSRGSISDVIGMELEVDQISSKGAEKEALGEKPGLSYKERFHYPLFKLPKEVMELRKANSLKEIGVEALKNPDFSEKPLSWVFGTAKGAQIDVGPYGMEGTGLKVNVPEGSDIQRPSAINQHIKIKEGAGRKVLLRALVKLEDVKKAEPTQGTFTNLRGLHLWWGFYDSKNKRQLGNTGLRDSEEGIFSSNGWKLYQFWTAIPGNADELILTAGLKGGCIGSLKIDHLDVEMN